MPEPAPWTVLARRTLVADRWLTLHADTVRTAEGALLDPFYVIDERSWSCVVPVLPDGRLALVEQYRHGAERIMLELPAGDLEAGEHPAAGAVRELQEETGFAALAEPVALGVLFPEPSRNRSRAHGFMVRVAASAGATSLDPAESIGVRLMTVAEAFAAIADGRLCHGVHVGFLWQARGMGLIA